MAVKVIRSKGVYNIIRKTLEIMDDKVMKHCEITGYILYKMLEAENMYTLHELAEYTMIGLVHDIGLIKTAYKKDLCEHITKKVWAHSIYGYLFLKYLSPLGDKANIVLYHHLDYELTHQIPGDFWKVTSYLALADKMDVFMRMNHGTMEPDYFVKYRDIKFSDKALKAFYRANNRFNIMEHLQDGSYVDELNELLTSVHFSEEYKKGYLQMLIYIIDFRSQQTVFHTLATRIFAVEIGRLMKLNASDLQILYYGALLHDVGKIAIPLSILEAPRRLDDSEMRIMRAHVQLTEMILNGVIDDSVLQAAIRHHEKLDGTGYPRGLKEEELTTVQKIVAVADILSALYGKRSYKEAFDADKVKSIMKSDADNGKICPVATDVVINNFDKIIEGYEKQREEALGIYETILEQYEVIYERFKRFE